MSKSVVYRRVVSPDPPGARVEQSVCVAGVIHYDLNYEVRDQPAADPPFVPSEKIRSTVRPCDGKCADKNFGERPATPDELRLTSLVTSG